MLNVKITTQPTTNPGLATSGNSNVPPTRSILESIFDELEPGWDNDNLQAFDYEAFLRKEGLV